MTDEYLGTGKRIYISLVLGVGAILCLLFLLVWLIPYFDFSSIYPAWTVLGIIVFATILTILYAVSSIVIYNYTGKILFNSRRLLFFFLKAFLPLAELLGRMLGFSVDEVRRSFIKLNNEIVAGSTAKVPGSDILLLLPHCLQASFCNRRLVHNANNCLRCNKCVQGDLLNLQDSHNIKLAIATGGTIARRIIVELKPKLIIAVACERDLASGIHDAYPLAVYGILNERPKGPCLDTIVNLELMNSTIKNFIA